MKKWLSFAVPVLCLLAFASLPLALPTHADTQWTLNDVTTQTGATISGTFDIGYNSNPLDDNLSSWNITYTPAGGGQAVVFNPSNVSQFGENTYVPEYNPQNLPFPPPFVTSFVALTNSAGDIIELDLPIATLPDLGPSNTVPVNEALCTTANSTFGNSGYVSLCGQLGASFFEGTSGLGPDYVDPGSLIGNYIPGTAGPAGSTGNTVPEPSTLALSALALVALALKRACS